MKAGIRAARMQSAIQEISKNTGVDLSHTALPKARSNELFQLFQLEKLASSEFVPVESINDVVRDTVTTTTNAILEKLANTKGITAAKLEIIENAIAELAQE